MKDGQDSGSKPRPRGRRGVGILVRLIIAFAVPTALLFAAFAYLAHGVAERELETELGKRLTAVAATAAGRIRNVAYLAQVEPGDEEDIAYLRARRELADVAKATGVARLYLFDKDYRSLADTRDDVALGSTYFQAELDRTELEQIFKGGDSVASVLFEGKDGQLYKAAYAPVVDERSGATLLVVGVDAPAALFSRLGPLRRNLFFVGAALLLVILVVAALVASRLTRPIRRLVEAAERIGSGMLDEEIPREGGGEIAFLAETMDRMRSDLRARDERSQMMIAGIAHEVRNPLGGIELFAGILRDEIDSDDERRDHVDRIVRELEYLKRVVEEFLDYARRPAPESSDFDLSDVAREIVAVIAADAEAAGLELESSLQSAPVSGDEGQLRRAFLNLARNAVQAGAADCDRPVVIRTRIEGDESVFETHNGGQPIPENVRERMFQPFYTSREKGTGLGLAFVREIVDDHSGNIIVVSESEQGTTFSVRLRRRSPG